MNTTRAMRKQVNDGIKDGSIIQLTKVSAVSKITRNLSKDECRRILSEKFIDYSNFPQILRQENLTFETKDAIRQGPKKSKRFYEEALMPSGDTKPKQKKESESQEHDQGTQDDQDAQGAQDAMEDEVQEFLDAPPSPMSEPATSDDSIGFVTTDPKQPIKVVNDVRESIGLSALEKSTTEFNKKMQTIIGSFGSALAKENKKVLALEKAIKNLDVGSGSIEIKVGTFAKPKKIEGVIHHPKFAEIVEKLEMNPDKCVYLCGGAGSGKTTLAMQISEALSLPFGSLSMTEGMSEAMLLGKPTITGGYVGTDFVEKYENGGVFLFDEMDAMDANVAVVVNSALANGFMSVPHRSENPVAKRHENFFVIACANTWGTGQGSNLYQGRNKLDGATLDRFEMVAIGYNPRLEKMLADDPIWYNAVLELRKRAEEYNLTRIVGTRTFKRAGIYKARGKSLKEFLASQTVHWSKEELAKVSLSDIVYVSKEMAV